MKQSAWMYQKPKTKQDNYICCLQEMHFSCKDTRRLKVKGRKKIFYAREIKRSGVVISNKTGQSYDQN